MRETENYTSGGGHELNFAIYTRTIGKEKAKTDYVLQHKIYGVETAHITLHPDGRVNFHSGKTEKYLQEAIDNRLFGYSPSPSKRLEEFLDKIS